MKQIRNKEIRILSDRLAIIRSYSRVGMDELFMGDGHAFVSNFSEAIRSGKRPLTASLRSLLEQAIDCAMTCHEAVMECSATAEHTLACKRCEVMRVLAENCFQLAKHLVSTGKISEILLLRCIAGCNATVALSSGFPSESFAKCAAACQRCKTTCIELYHKVLDN